MIDQGAIERYFLLMGVTAVVVVVAAFYLGVLQP